jgi:hypothetical protein
MREHGVIVSIIEKKSPAVFCNAAGLELIQGFKNYFLLDAGL